MKKIGDIVINKDRLIGIGFIEEIQNEIDVKRLRGKQSDICDQIRDLIIEVLEEKGE